MKALRIAALVVALAVPLRAQERTRPINPDIALPEPTGFLTDPTHAVPHPDVVEARLRAIREQDSLSLVAVVLATTSGRDAADVAREIGRRWFVAQASAIGTQVRNTGGVILLVLDTHKCRIEVATGSEGYMTDAMAGDACRSARESFRAGAFDQGLLLIANQFDDRHQKDRVALAPAAAAAEPAEPRSVGFWVAVWSVVALIGMLLVAWGTDIRKKRRAERAKEEAQRAQDEAERQAAYAKQAEIRRQQEAEAAAKEAARWAALTPAQQAEELRLRRLEEEDRRRRQAEAEIAAAAAAAARRAEEEEENRRSSSYTDSSSSSSSSSSGSDYSGGGSDSFGGGGGGDSW